VLVALTVVAISLSAIGSLVAVTIRGARSSADISRSPKPRAPS
jgi:hypothetical protein